VHRGAGIAVKGAIDDGTRPDQHLELHLRRGLGIDLRLGSASLWFPLRLRVLRDLQSKRGGAPVL